MKKNKNIFFCCLYHNFLNNARKNLKFWVSSLFIVIYQSLKFQVNRKHRVLNPSDLACKTPYICTRIYILNDAFSLYSACLLIFTKTRREKERERERGWGEGGLSFNFLFVLDWQGRFSNDRCSVKRRNNSGSIFFSWGTYKHTRTQTQIPFLPLAISFYKNRKGWLWTGEGSNAITRGVS